jgi:hypothetical protein
MLERDVRNLLSEVAGLAESIGDPEAIERTTTQYEIATLFDRCRGMFGAAVLLLDNGFVHEAAIFCRPLFTDSLVLAETATANETRRIELVVGRRLAALADIEGIFRELQARGDDEVAPNIEYVAEQRRKAEEYARRHGAGTKHWDPSDDVKGLAERHDRGIEYAGYRMTSHFVHGSPAITQERGSLGDDDVVRVGGPAIKVDVWETASALFAAYSLALACRATCKVLGYPEPDRLNAAIKRIEEIQNLGRY